MENQAAQAAETAQGGAQAGLSGRPTATLSKGRGGVVGVKAGMTQVYGTAGENLAVTVIDLAPLVVTQVKTQKQEGYAAVQVGLLPKRSKLATLAERGHAKKSGAEGFYHYQEFRFGDDADLAGLEVGQLLTAGFLKEGDFVDLTSTSKGKGYQGGMKRFHMAGGFKSHGASVSHRSLGSIGNRADPAKCFKNKKMAGQMGFVRTTVQNVRVVRVDLENQLLLVHGSVPGPKSGIVTVRRAVKKQG
jgi:large subunit ribosomal protein L3